MSSRYGSEVYVDASELADVPLKIAGDLPTGGLSDVRIFRRWLNNEEVQLLARESTLKKLLKSGTPWDDLDLQDHATPNRFHNQVINNDYRDCARDLSATQRRRDLVYSRSTTTPVMQERPSAPRAWVLERGAYDQRREQVAPAVPEVLDFDKTEFQITGDGLTTRTENRLDLAQWLVHPDHPLTARIMVNRLWQSVFGVGLVKTSEGFGVMGDRPTYPALLDWLAVEFVESGWNVNHILRLIISSSTYLQSSVFTVEKLQLNPDNRFLARGPRLRLDAEILRNQALVVSAFLHRDIGGPSVKTYQPAGLWEVVAISESNTREFQPDSGDALYRRSVYTFWKRTAPPPAMAAFNAPAREQCTVRRERTNTPLQALVLMNDLQFVEAARHLAQTALKRSSKDETRAAWMLRTALSRPKKEVDTVESVSSARSCRALFQQTPPAAQRLIHCGDSNPDEPLDAAELAAWTMVANAIMNRDDFLNK